MHVQVHRFRNCPVALGFDGTRATFSTLLCRVRDVESLYCGRGLDQKACAIYQHWDALTYQTFLARVKDVKLVAAPRDVDEADTLALGYLKTHADRKEHLLVYDSELHDVTLFSTRGKVWHDSDRVKAVVKDGKPLIFFHKSSGGGRPGRYVSQLRRFWSCRPFSFMAYTENPGLTVEFRLVELSEESTVVSYRFKQRADDEIRNLALAYRDARARLAVSRTSRFSK